MRYNLEIFTTWFIFIACRKPVSQEVYNMIKNHYGMTERERKLLTRIAKLNNLEL